MLKIVLEFNFLNSLINTNSDESCYFDELSKTHLIFYQKNDKQLLKTQPDLQQLINRKIINPVTKDIEADIFIAPQYTQSLRFKKIFSSRKQEISSLHSDTIEKIDWKNPVFFIDIDYTIYDPACDPKGTPKLNSNVIDYFKKIKVKYPDAKYYVMTSRKSEKNCEHPLLQLFILLTAL